MNLENAMALCGWKQAKLIIKDPADPLAWGTGISATEFGTLYMWTKGHTVPMLVSNFRDDLPRGADQEVCVCGKRHGFPSMRNKRGAFRRKPYELWSKLTLDERWEPVNPITILDALIRENPDAAGRA